MEKFVSCAIYLFIPYSLADVNTKKLRITLVLFAILYPSQRQSTAQYVFTEGMEAGRNIRMKRTVMGPGEIFVCPIITVFLILNSGFSLARPVVLIFCLDSYLHYLKGKNSKEHLFIWGISIDTVLEIKVDIFFIIC